MGRIIKTKYYLENRERILANAKAKRLGLPILRAAKITRPLPEITRPMTVKCAQCSVVFGTGARGPISACCSKACARRKREGVPPGATLRPGRKAGPSGPWAIRISTHCPVCGAERNGTTKALALRRTCSRKCAGIAKRLTLDEHRRRLADQRNQWSNERRERLKAATPKGCPVNINRKKIFERDGWTCRICKRPVNPDAHWSNPSYPNLDHIIPVVRGGLNTEANTQCLCRKCNTHKRDRITTPIQLLVPFDRMIAQ